MQHLLMDHPHPLVDACMIVGRYVNVLTMHDCEFTNIRGSWNKHFDAMAEDYHRTHASDASVLQLVLKDIANIVKSMGKDINNYGLPELHKSGISFMLFDCCVYCIS